MRKLISLCAMFILVGISNPIFADTNKDGKEIEVYVGLSNRIVADTNALVVDYTEFKSSDLFDSGTKNYSMNGKVDHTYYSGPKNIKYEIKMRLRVGKVLNFSECPYIKQAENCTSRVKNDWQFLSCSTAPISTGDNHFVGMLIKIDDLDVKCIYKARGE